MNSQPDRDSGGIGFCFVLSAIVAFWISFAAALWWFGLLVAVAYAVVTFMVATTVLVIVIRTGT